MPTQHSPGRAPFIWPALGVGLLGLLWIAQSYGFIASDLPLGPLCAVGTALALLAYELNR